ncbi:MAG: hypothetical protein ACYTF7_06240 [Planctomycetota bacterium]|jgi:hypothetical protein
MNKLAIGFAASVAAVALWASPAHAFVAWSNSNGSGTGFDWMNGGSLNGLYGDPTLVSGNTLIFFPNNFRADSANGVTDFVTDTIMVDILAAPGQEISGITISEFGDWAINSAGQIDIEGTVTVTDLNDPGRNGSDNLIANPGNSFSTPGSGEWNGTMGIDLAGMGGDSWTWIHIELTNTLTAYSQSGTSSFVEKKIGGAGIQMTLIPPPGTGMLLALSGVIASRRRR